MSKHIGIVLHGGASESWIGDTESYHNTNTFLKSLVSRAEVLLRERAFAIDVATQVVAELEDYPAFNAGKGAAVNIDGNFELEAGIVNGATSAYCAAVCLQATKNPIKLARAMLDSSGQGTPIFIAGPNGDTLAERLGLDLVPNSYFATENRVKYWSAKKAEISEHGTVGAVVLDAHGNLAAANSTGGMMFKAIGRVGDTAVLGSGLYADKNVAIVCGGGEAILASMLASRIAMLYNNGVNIAKAVEQGIWNATQVFPSLSCGVIAIAADGQQTAQCNSRIFNTISAGSTSTTTHEGLLPCTMRIIAPLCFYEDSWMRVGVSKHPTRLNQVTFQLKEELSLVKLSHELTCAIFGKLRRVCQSLVQVTGASDIAMLTWSGNSGGHLFPIFGDGNYGVKSWNKIINANAGGLDYQAAPCDAFTLVRLPLARADSHARVSMFLLESDVEFNEAVALFLGSLKDKSIRKTLYSGDWSVFAGPISSLPLPPAPPVSASSTSAQASAQMSIYHNLLVALLYKDPHWPGHSPFQNASSDYGLGSQPQHFTPALGQRSLDISNLLQLADRLRKCRN